MSEQGSFLSDAIGQGGWVVAAAMGMWSFGLRLMLGRHYAAQDRIDARLGSIEQRLSHIEGRLGGVEKRERQ